tara:strand:+ start:1240 stop:2043 length:804 start_codon:yes stop_codon:yes gene_type:complete
MSKLKTVWDAVNELRGDLNNTHNFNGDEVYLFYFVCHDSIGSSYSNHGSHGDINNICTIAEFNALVEEMKNGLDVNHVNHAHYLNYVDADKVLLEKEAKPDYTSLEFWNDAPEGAEYYNKECEDFKEAWYKNITASSFEILVVKEDLDWVYCGYKADRLIENMVKRPQPIPTETPEEKEALDSIVNKPLVYTQEMADNGELPSVGMKCLFKMNGEYKAITVLYNSQEVMVFSYIFDGVMVEDAMLKPFKYVDIKPIDIRTKKEKAID